MRLGRNIDKLIKKLDLKASADLDEKTHRRIDNASAGPKETWLAQQPNIWIIIVKSRITQLAAVLSLVLVTCWLTLIVSNRNKAEQNQTNRPVVTASSKTPAELMSFISLSRAFRDGDMEAMEKQFDEAEKKVGPGLRERITIDQLMCELDYCEEI